MLHLNLKQSLYSRENLQDKKKNHKKKNEIIIMLEDQMKNARMQSIRSNTTKVKSGTLPLAAYQHQTQQEMQTQVIQLDEKQ